MMYPIGVGMRPKSSGSLANFMFLSQHYKLQKKSFIYRGFTTPYKRGGASRVPTQATHPTHLTHLAKKTIFRDSVKGVYDSDDSVWGDSVCIIVPE